MDISAGPRPRRPGVRTYRRVNQVPPSWISPDVTDRQTHSAGVRAAPDVAKLISCFYWWLLVPPLQSFSPTPPTARRTVFLLMIGQQAVPIVTDPAVALGDGEVEPLLLFGVLGTRPLVTPDPEDPSPSSGLRGALPNILYIYMCAHARTNIHKLF